MGALRKLRRGEKPQMGHLNQFVSGLAEVNRRLRSLETGTQRQAQQPALWAWAKNGTGADLRKGDAAAVDGGIADNLDKVLEDGAVLLLRAFDTGSAPRDDSANWVIAEDEIPDGEIGKVYVAGVCPARATGSGDYATAPTDGSAVLARGASGAKVIKDIEATISGNGERWVLVRIGTVAKDQETPAGFGDTTPVVHDETGTAGTSTLARRSDAMPGNALVGTPGLVKDNAAALVPTLEYIYQDDPVFALLGQRVRLGAVDYGYLAAYYAHLEPRGSADHVRKTGLILPLDPDGFLQGNAAGLRMQPPNARGDMLTAQGATPKWAVLSKPSLNPGETKYIGISEGDNEPSYKDAPSGGSDPSTFHLDDDVALEDGWNTLVSALVGSFKSISAFFQVQATGGYGAGVNISVEADDEAFYQFFRPGIGTTHDFTVIPIDIPANTTTVTIKIYVDVSGVAYKNGAVFTMQ